MRKKSTFSINFKKQAIAYMEKGNTPHAAAKHFGGGDGRVYDHSIFYQWRKQKQLIKDAGGMAKQVSGAGRKPKLSHIEDILANEVIILRIDKIKVTRSFICSRARLLAEDAGLEGWLALRDERPER
jgi:hypothetical protein